MSRIDEPRWNVRGRVCRVAWLAAALAAGGGGGCGQSPAPGSGPISVVATFGEVGLSPGQFSYPRAMDTDGGSLWVVDKSARVQRIDGNTGAYRGGWRMPEYAFGKPVGITIGPGEGGEELVYVADTHYHRVLAYRPGAEERAAPTIVAEIGSFGEEPGQFIYPTDVAVLVEPGSRHPSRLYISEYGGNDRISVFEHAGEPNTYRFAFSFGTMGESSAAENVQFKRPQAIELNPARRELVVADSCNHRVGRFTLEGRLIAWIGANRDPAGTAAGSPSEDEAEFQYPYGLCLRADGTALVCEFGASRVHHVDLESGRSLGVFGVPGRGPGELASPWAVTAIGERVYVLDSGNCRIEAFDLPLLARHVAAGPVGPGGPR